MPSSRSVSSKHSTAHLRQYRRSSFNGARQLEAAGAKNRRVLAAVGLLALALVATLVVVAVHLASREQ